MKKYLKWTIDSSLLEAKKYDVRNEFSKSSPRAYEILRKNKLLDIGCKHMIVSYGIMIKWNKDKCLKKALKYNSRMEFQKGDKKAYEAAKNHGWLAEICSHMKYYRLPNGYWNNIENCKERALMYKTRKDFIKKSPHVYNKSLKMRWVDEICKHMILCDDKYNRCIYVYEFSDNHVYVGLTCNLERRQYDRNSDVKDSVTAHIIKTGLEPVRKQLTDYISVKEAIKKEVDVLNEYVINGWIPLNKIKTGSIGSYSIKEI